MASEYISPSDRDYAIRTMIGEASNQDDDGLAAVGHVIMNRARSGKYGGENIRNVVLAPSQFEPWQTRRDELLGYAPDSEPYARAAGIFDGILKGERADNTEGSTHFLNEKIVRERRGGNLPKWASGEGRKIGDHTFYGGKPVNPEDGIFEEYGRKAPRSITTSPDDGIFDDFARKPGGSAPASPTRDGRPRVIIGPDSGTFTQKLVSDMPVVGPLVDKAMAGAFTTLDSVGNILRGKPNEGTFSERFGQNVADQETRNELYAEKNPIKGGIASVAGPMMALGPLMGPMSIAATRAAPAALSMAQNLGQRAMGMRGNSLGAKALQGGTSMAAIEAGNQLLRGKDPRAQGLTGPVPLAAAGGVAGPMIGEGIAAGANAIIDRLPVRTGMMKGTNSVTRNKLTGALDGETPASLAQARNEHGEAGMLLDLNQGTRDIAGGLADIPGPPKAQVREALRERAAGQSVRMVESLDNNMTRQVDTAQLVKSINDQRDEAATPLYKAFRESTIDKTPEIEKLIPRLKEANAFKLADELAGIRTGSADTISKQVEAGTLTPETWDYVKRGLDRRISAAAEKTKPDNELYRELVTLKKDMLAEIEKTEGGKVWKQAREIWSEAEEIKHQVDEGRKTFARATRSDDLREELKTLSKTELAARIQGMRDEVQEVIDSTLRGDTTARNKLLSRAGQEKLEMLLGDKRAGRLVNDLEAELKLAKNREEIVGGSPTAGKQARRDALLPERGKPGYISNINLTQPSTLIPESMTPGAIMEGAAVARHETSRNQLGNYMTMLMKDPRFEDLLADIVQHGANQAARRGRAAEVATGVAGMTQGMQSGPRNRLLAPPAEERRSGATR